MTRAEVLAAVLAEHFVMWRDLDGPIAGEWFCQCGAKFGFSDTAIRHQTDTLVAALAAPEGGCTCGPCPGRGYDGHRMNHCAECCFGTGLEDDPGCPVHHPHEGERGGAEVAAAVEAVCSELETLAAGNEAARGSATKVAGYYRRCAAKVRAALADPAGALAKVRADAWDAGEKAGMQNHSAYRNTGKPAHINPHHADRIAGDQP